MDLSEDPKNNSVEQAHIPTKIAATLKVEDSQPFAKTRLFRPVPSDPNAYVVPQSSMEDAEVVAKALCAIRKDRSVFRGSYYKICSSPKEKEKKFAELATFAMEKVVVFADDIYGYILVNYGGNKAFNDLKDKHGNELPALKKCTGAYNVTKAEAKVGHSFVVDASASPCQRR